MGRTTIGSRIQQVLLELSAKRNGRLTLEDLGALIGNAEKGRRRPYSSSAVSEWIQGRNEPRIATIEAIAKVSGRSRGWVAFGEPN
jgi:transcriptional regulator with XRE-family HTH domain